MMKEETIALKLKFIYFLAAGAQACYYPFLIIFLKEKHLNYTQMGICFGAVSITGVFFQPLIGYVTDRYIGKKKVLLYLTLICALILGITTQAEGFAELTLLSGLFSAFMSSIYPVIDSLGIEVSHIYKNFSYYRTRLMGSIGYAVLVVLVGIAVKETSAEVAFYLYILCNLVSLIFIAGINIKESRSYSSINLGSVAALIKNRRFVFFLASALILNIAINANGNYIEELIVKTGGNVIILGFLWGIVAMCEVPTFYNGSKLLKKIIDYKLYMACLLFYVIRFMLDSYCKSWEAVLLVQTMQTVTYALYTLSAMNYIGRVADTSILTTALTLHSAVGGGIGGFIGGIAGGVLIEKYSITGMYKALALICLAAFVLYLGAGSERKKIIQE